MRKFLMTVSAAVALAAGGNFAHADDNDLAVKAADAAHKDYIIQEYNHLNTISFCKQFIRNGDLDKYQRGLTEFQIVLRNANYTKADDYANSNLQNAIGEFIQNQSNMLSKCNGYGGLVPANSAQ